jgi:DNA topoisomerase-1
LPSNALEAEALKYVMKSLKHNGVYIPPCELLGLSVKIQGNTLKLGPRTEQMALAWVRKEQSQTSPPDRLFYKNFTRIFLEALKLEKPSAGFLSNFRLRDDVDPLVDGKPREDMEIDFSQVRQYVLQEQLKKLNMSKEEKKKLAAERKTRREALRKTYGYATVDGKETEISNWTAEPSCLFAGRGDHPRRGNWKQGPTQSDVTLNLSPDAPRPLGDWKDIVWEPDRMYVAKWEDKLTGKIKYVWFSDSTFMKQLREKEKFKKAQKLGSKVRDIEEHIMENFNSEKEERRKIATVCWLIFNLNMRVGDEKDPGEADTVGAITLRPEHIKIEGDVLHFDFLGKDAVRWTKDAKAPPIVVESIKRYSSSCKEYLFEGIDSGKVARFFSETMKGLTAKVFRTWRCTTTVDECLNGCKTKKEDPEHRKKFCAKKANLEAAIVANHKRKIPANFDERLAKKEAGLKELENDLKVKVEQGKKTDALLKRIEKNKLDVELTKATREYNLGTSLKSYIDPMTYVRWANNVEFDLDKFYPKTLKNKYSWALGGKR